MLLTEHYLPSVQRGELNTVQRLAVRGAEGRQVIYSLSVIHRVQGFLFSRPNWVPPPTHPQGSVAPPSFGTKGGETLACWVGSAGGPNHDEGTDTLALYVL
jgi:hypothetical protein